MVTYPLDEVQLATLFGVVCGADDWDGVEEVATGALDWLRGFLLFKNGIPTRPPSPKLGEMFTAAGGKWEQTSIAGHTANTLAKLRADVVAGNAPPAVQLKGPEIAEWNATGMTANLDDLANKEGWDKVVAPELLPVMKPTGHWVAAPMNIHRINWLWASTKAMEQAGVKKLPKT